MSWTTLLRRVKLLRADITPPDTAAPDAVAKQAFVARIKATLAA